MVVLEVHCSKFMANDNVLGSAEKFTQGPLLVIIDQLRRRIAHFSLGVAQVKKMSQRIQEYRIREYN